MQLNFHNEVEETISVKVENATDQYEKNNSINNFHIYNSENVDRKSIIYSKNSLSFSVQSILSSTISNELIGVKEQERKIKTPDIKQKIVQSNGHEIQAKESGTSLHYPNITLTNIGYKVNFLQSQLATNPSALSPIIPRFLDHSNKPTMVMANPFSTDGPAFLSTNLWRGHAVLPTAKFSMFGSIMPTSLPTFPNNFTSAGLQAILSNLQFRNRPRRSMLRRSVFSDGQRQGLEESFKKHAYITKPDRKDLADQLGLKDAQVKIWFQNRRMKWRNSKDRDLSAIEPVKKSDNYKEKKDQMNSNEKFLKITSEQTDKKPTKLINNETVENLPSTESTELSIKNDKLSLDYLIH